MGCQLGIGVIVVRPHGKARRNARNSIYRIVIFAGALLIAPWTAQVLGERPTWQAGYYGAYALVGVMLTGLALTWWARIDLGWQLAQRLRSRFPADGTISPLNLIVSTQSALSTAASWGGRYFQRVWSANHLGPLGAFHGWCLYCR